MEIAKPCFDRATIRFDEADRCERLGGWGVVSAMRSLALLAFAAATAPVAAQPTAASASVSPRAAELFESDWVLMNWALKYYDRDRDVLLEPDEVQTAAAQFREIADADDDGRVTAVEYRAAREFILARY
jgi:hypothetical protein